MRKTIWLLTLLALVLTLWACKSNAVEKTIWVNSAKVDCVGVGPMKCYQVKESETDAWSYFYQEIDGFEFEPGFIYQLKVNVTQLSAQEVAADQSTLEYALIEVMSKEADPVLGLNDIWKLIELNGAPIDDIKTRKQLPYVEINTKNRTLMGFDGCNNFRGEIASLSANELSFVQLVNTRKFCPEMTIPNEIGAALAQVTNYKKEGLVLELYNSNNTLLCRFKKVD